MFGKKAYLLRDEMGDAHTVASSSTMEGWRILLNSVSGSQRVCDITPTPNLILNPVMYQSL